MGGTHPEMLDTMYKQLKVWRQHFKVSYHLLRKKKKLVGQDSHTEIKSHFARLHIAV